MSAAELTSTAMPEMASAGGPSKGKGAKKRNEQRFRQKKNAEFTSQLQATLLKRLHVSDPTNIPSVKLQSAIVPARIPVVLRGIPAVLSELWSRMLAIGSRPFATIAQDPASRAIFFKVSLLLFEAKVCFAQRLVQSRPPFDFPTQFAFTDMMLRKIVSISGKLPFPLAIALEAVGLFSLDSQEVVPVFATVEPPVASGALNFTRTDLRILVNALSTPQPPNAIIVQIAQALTCLPLIEWIVHEDGTTNLSPASIAFWGSDDLLPPNEREVYLKIVASMESKRGFLLLTTIDSGAGSPAQAVRFPSHYDQDETETLYYMNSIVPTFDEQLAPALMLGYEYQIIRFSRFLGSYDECLKHGSACQSGVRHALIWADKA